MPAPDRLLTTLRTALARVNDTPGRVGHRVGLANCSSVLVVGDLHGHVGNFQAVWKKADLANHSGRHLVLQELVHGKFHYPSGGGDRSHQLVDLFAAVKCQFPDRVHYLPGNHEMAQWTGRRILKGDTDQNVDFRRGVETAYGPAAAEILDAYAALFKACPLAIDAPNGVFLSHTITPAKHLDAFDPIDLDRDDYPPTAYEPGGVAYGICWGRDVSPANAVAFLRKVRAEFLVTGHVPADDGFTIPNDYQITLDCSATPGGYCLFPTDRRPTLANMVPCVGVV